MKMEKGVKLQEANFETFPNLIETWLHNAWLATLVPLADLLSSL